MLKYANKSFQFGFDQYDQEFTMVGYLRPERTDDFKECLLLLRDSVAIATGKFHINARRLVQVNNVAFNGLATLLMTLSRERPDVEFMITTSSVLGWSKRKFNVLGKTIPNIMVREYDGDFYPGQEFVEDSSFITVLRNQTKMTWRHERGILKRHGLKKGMAVADICCGIGDFAVLLQKEFQPSHIVALDHAKPSLEYARNAAKKLGIRDIDYVYGDAAELLLDDNQFDFVICRHSLQVFNRPELILSELFRICKPGGRVYISNEKNSHCLGEPRSDSIQWTYNEVAKLWRHFAMDIELGPKSRWLMAGKGFVDIRMESFMVTNLDGEPNEFADIIRTWKRLFADDMARKRGDDEAFIKKFKKGFDDHIFAAMHPRGYAGWPIWVASGQKPQ